MRARSLGRVYQLLEPGPVVLVTTARAGQANVMTMSWHMMVEFVPPLVACVVSEANHSFRALRETGECVIAIPPRSLAHKVVRVGNTSGRDVDKFAKFGLSTRPAARVAPPLVDDCFANLECVVRDTRFVRKYNLFILEVVKAWVRPGYEREKTIHHRGHGVFAVDGETIRLRSEKA